MLGSGTASCGRQRARQTCWLDGRTNTRRVKLRTSYDLYDTGMLGLVSVLTKACDVFACATLDLDDERLTDRERCDLDCTKCIQVRM